MRKELMFLKMSINLSQSGHVESETIPDHHYRTKTPPELPDDYFVWVDTPQGQVQGNIVLTAPEPRSYHVTIPTGHIWRNLTCLRVTSIQIYQSHKL